MHILRYKKVWELNMHQRYAMPFYKADFFLYVELSFLNFNKFASICENTRNSQTRFPAVLRDNCYLSPYLNHR